MTGAVAGVYEAAGKASNPREFSRARKDGSGRQMLGITEGKCLRGRRTSGVLVQVLPGHP